MTARPSSEVDYTPLVAAAFGAAAWLLVVKVLAVLVAANAVQATVEVALALGVFPYLRIAGTAPAFTAVVTVSVAAMAAGAGAIMLRPALAGRWRRQVVRGRAVGVILAFETLLFEMIRHRFAAPVLRPEWVWVAAAVLTAAVAAAAWAVWRADPDAPPGSAKGSTPPPIEVPSATQGGAVHGRRSRGGDGPPPTRTLRGGIPCRSDGSPLAWRPSSSQC